jgi:pentose-5-phosphate-3-epimerase
MYKICEEKIDNTKFMIIFIDLVDGQYVKLVCVEYAYLNSFADVKSTYINIDNWGIVDANIKD